MYMINTGFDLVRLRMIVERVSQSLTFPVAAYEQAREGCPRFGLVGSVLQEQKSSKTQCSPAPILEEKTIKKQ